MKISITIFIFSLFLFAEVVEITKGVAFVTVFDTYGKSYKISRNQKPNSYLTNTFARTSRPSPPFYIEPFEVMKGVETYGELEVLDFIKHKKGFFIDARLENWYKESAIPTSINIPFKLFLIDTPERDNILSHFGGKLNKGLEEWDFSNAKELLLYCNGAWCGQSPTAIYALIALGYPKEKLKYYRGGMQAWQILGLTIIKPKEIK